MHAKVLNTKPGKGPNPAKSFIKTRRGKKGDLGQHLLKLAATFQKTSIERKRRQKEEREEGKEVDGKRSN